ncbi:hypothetical protein F5879DRAFT_984985 [Lentinula edodes]|uniref:uncharacterized protein n=1 Tax=Lentinula edodes TaxID=5353 RepID=UPI001E8CD215|nr:uncharacterized protein C8R40DRAFT_1171307 [Lentinula edodes]KAH7874702.1 hypothetical protein C8R40DRAFT_1171307 [Lentinula edodes]KAJ3909191.1 hypothetical protein F5879DRAFT_984985 [Lentinula edodes]KAJ3920396.1 hypothetical protein F5877DRAFT_77136 [Lentinula edodes]
MFSSSLFAHCMLAFLFLGVSNAFPLLNRQATATAQLSTPTTLTTVTSSMTPAGPLTQTCVITLTPITDSNGKPAVQEVKNCTVAVNASNGTTANTLSNSPASSSSASSSNAATAASTTTTSAAATAESSTSTVSPATSATAASTSSVSANAAISVNGISTMTSLAPGTQTASASVSSSASDSAAAVSASSAAATSVASASAGSASGASATATSSSATAAADNSNPTASLSTQQLAETTYVVPGKSLQVLPIGLGVFAGISALALIVVGLVTYERTKYRKAFRQRKLAEQGAAMGYSG